MKGQHRYPILCMTSDHYIWAIRPYAHLIKKYWPDHPDVIVAGFTQPEFELPERFTFLSLGEFHKFPVQRWSDALYIALRNVGSPAVIFMLEDYWINKPVHTDIVLMCEDYVNQFEYVARMDLTGDRLHAGGAALYGKIGNVGLIWSSPDSPYHLSLMTGIWRVNHLISVLVPNETPWDLEISGTPRLAARRNDVIVLGTNAWPVHHTLAFRGGDHSELLLNGLDPEDVTEMRGLGLIP